LSETYALTTITTAIIKNEAFAFTLKQNTKAMSMTKIPDANAVFSILSLQTTRNCIELFADKSCLIT